MDPARLQLPGAHGGEAARVPGKLPVAVLASSCQLQSQAR